MLAEAFISAMGNRTPSMSDPSRNASCHAFHVEEGTREVAARHERSPFTAGESTSSRGPMLRSLLLGQGISVLITGTGVFSASLADAGVSLPATQSSLNYILLAFHLLWEVKRMRREGLAKPWWRYLIWAFADVEANYLAVSAYRYTSVASVMLLDCFAIPCSMVLLRASLGAQYTKTHVAACLICISGLGLTVLSDCLSRSADQHSAPAGTAWIGDLLILSAAAIYALSNVQQELLLKEGTSRCEALGMLGLWGSVINCSQAWILEGTQLVQVAWTWRLLGSILGFQFCLFGMYVMTSIFLQISDATVFNLSLLTSDVYSIIFSWQVQHRYISWMYGFAFATTLSGLVLYHTQPPVFEETA